MRTKKTNKLLALKKVTVSCLSNDTLSRVNGGAEGEALRTRYTACNNGARNERVVITGNSMANACVSNVIGCVEA